MQAKAYGSRHWFDDIFAGHNLIPTIRIKA